MDVVVIFNGLGNQMSQYAYYLAKKKVNPNTKVIFDIMSKHNHYGYDLERAFGIEVNKTLLIKVLQIIYVLSRKFRLFKSVGVRTIYEPLNYDYTPLLMQKGPWGINYYVGGWHSEKNFMNVPDEVKKAFMFREQPNEDRFNEWLQVIRGDNSSVSVHIRRGDYMNIEPTGYYQLNGVATLDYYHEAIDYIRQYVDTPHFYVFSNDLDWCKEQFGVENFFYIECNQGVNSWRDMYLMSECHYHINANSTFSWWGAWLCKFEDSITEIWRLFMISSDKLELLPKSFFLLCKEIFNSFWGMYAPSDAPLWYVRDLMAVMVLAPIIFFVINKCGKYVVIVLTFIWLLGLWPRLPIVPGIDIILFVTWGAYFAMKGIEPFRKMASLTGYWPVYIISLLWAVWEYDELAYNFPIRLSILLGLSLVSALFLYIDKHEMNVPKILTASSFFTYCLHWIYVAPLTSCVVFMIQPESEITVVLIYFACIFLTLIISLLSFLILRILSPRLLLLFTGSRG